MTWTAEQALEQKRSAIVKATAVRTARAELKRRIRAGEVSFHQALGWQCVQSMEIRKLLLCLPTIGHSKTGKYLRVLGISPSTQVQNLSESRRRQLEELVG